MYDIYIHVCAKTVKYAFSSINKYLCRFQFPSRYRTTNHYNLNCLIYFLLYNHN